MTFYIKNYDGNYHRTMREFTQTRPHLVVTETKLSDSSPQELVVEAKMSRDELNDFINGLENGAVQFQYYKKDGTLRNACGTRLPALMADEDVEILRQALAQEKSKFLIPYYDFQKKELRQFHVSRFVKNVDSIAIAGAFEISKVKSCIDSGKFSNFDQLSDPSLYEIIKSTPQPAMKITDRRADTRVALKDILTRNFSASPSKIDAVVEEIMQEVF